MKIYKQKEHSLILKPFGIGQRLYMAVNILVFFDLENPDSLLGEQELWSLIPAQLGDQAVLDMGMPKPRGEVLVTGSCFAPRDTVREASQVSLRIGPVRKKLAVFGDRFWEQKAGRGKLISGPRPFSEVPLTYANAFGGPGFDANPLGKGIGPVSGPDGRPVHPLPNIEYPGRLIGSPADRPPPAGFGPLELTWPQRTKKQGTYDDKWLKQRWPYFPEDMDFEFFNTAPEDQFLEGFFNGDEQIELVNMHPEKQVIGSRLPGARMRCFVTRLKSLDPSEKEEVFEEVSTRIDTVWLFPTIMRAVVMYRGTCRILDDEFGDVKRILVATEKAGDRPCSKQEYYRRQQEACDRSVKIDTAGLEAAQKKIGRAIQRFRNLPKEIQRARMRAMGKAPRMPGDNLARIREKTGRMLGAQAALLDRLEAQARAMHAKWGHLAKLDLEIFDTMRARIAGMEKRADQAAAGVEEARSGIEAARKKISATLKERLKPEDLAKAGVDPDNLMAGGTANPWHDRGLAFVAGCRRQLEADGQTMEMLEKLGLAPGTVRRTWMGINRQVQTEKRSDWGLERATDGRDDPDWMRLPPGLVIPCFEEALLKRILILEGWQEGDPRLTAVDGSDRYRMFLPAACLVDLPGVQAARSAPAVVVADEFQALLVEQEVGDCCSVAVLADPAAKAGKEAAAVLEEAPVLLVVTDPGLDGKGWQAWQKAYPNARRLDLPCGRTVFQARAGGTHIRDWIMEALGPELAAACRQEPVIPEAGKAPAGSFLEGISLPEYDIKALVKGLTDEIKAFHQPGFDDIAKAKERAEQKARRAIAMLGKDPDKVLSGSRAAPDPVGSAEKIAAAIGRQKEKLQAAGGLTPELEKNLDRQAAAALEMGRQAGRRLKQGRFEMEAAGRKIAKVRAGGIPDEIKEKFEVHGLDPEKIRKLTRQEVIERHGRGESLAGAVLNGLDLSGLDLKGIDLKQAQCRKTNFSGSDLSGADLGRTLAMEADFSGAVLRQARSQKGIFTRACFRQADLREADFSMAVVQGADLGKALCRGARFHMSVFQKAVLEGADFSEALVRMAVFGGATANDAVFRRARLSKCLFKDTLLEGADFSAASLPATLFQACRGSGVSFAGADLGKTRIGGSSDFCGADFSGMVMEQGSFRESVLRGADFSGARIRQSMMEACDLRQARLAGVSLVKTRLEKSNLEGVDMRRVNLFQGSLRKARLVNTDLRGANLYGVDFYKAVMGATRLEGANCKHTLIEDRTEYLK